MCVCIPAFPRVTGSGFIDCATEIDAEKVIQILRNKQMPDGSRLAVKFAYVSLFVCEGGEVR